MHPRPPSSDPAASTPAPSPAPAPHPPHPPHPPPPHERAYAMALPPPQTQPPPPHIQPAHSSTVFVEPVWGKPYPIFVDEKVPGRERIVTLIRRHGGIISSSPFASVFVIVDPNSQIGRDWAWAFRDSDRSGHGNGNGNDQPQIVLESSWIYKCVDHGRVKGVGEGWGGCRLESKKPGEECWEGPAYHHHPPPPIPISVQGNNPEQAPMYRPLPRQTPLRARREQTATPFEQGESPTNSTAGTSKIHERFPSPPRSAPQAKRINANEFSEEDIEYLHKCVEFAEANGIGRGLWQQIEARAPHHSLESWRTKWRRIKKKQAEMGTDVPMAVLVDGADTVDAADSPQVPNRQQTDLGYPLEQHVDGVGPGPGPGHGISVGVGIGVGSHGPHGVVPGIPGVPGVPGVHPSSHPNQHPHLHQHQHPHHVPHPQHSHPQAHPHSHGHGPPLNWDHQLQMMAQSGSQLDGGERPGPAVGVGVDGSNSGTGGSSMSGVSAPSSADENRGAPQMDGVDGIDGDEGPDGGLSFSVFSTFNLVTPR
ncbi:hypothetical protein BOTBODRAFT_173277 [Botryobasidium botryosum FD-172 SS1]|uniref:TERF2-interacting telomeric protein 1 Myb domain-containing protein n=1 Tax=Botryobasidium botryosum (strain FD-172 SS1) TaxID=930990 RepID=A0A067MNY0_BOTB1|nr:hypothetical protein BOTBODRAFT_173277 [Botryobasidium botryosum FD-172 SS1]